MDLVIGKNKISEIYNWIMEKLDDEEVEDILGVSKSELKDKHIVEYLIGIIENNLQYDFSFEYGLD